MTERMIRMLLLVLLAAFAAVGSGALHAAHQVVAHADDASHSHESDHGDCHDHDSPPATPEPEHDQSCDLCLALHAASAVPESSTPVDLVQVQITRLMPARDRVVGLGVTSLPPVRGPPRA